MMKIKPPRHEQELLNIGNELYEFISQLYPICRSITGNGFRHTLERIQEYIPLDIKEVPTGTQVWDWTVPKEWNINDAYVKNSQGKRIIDFQRSNLHVVNYSVPVPPMKMNLAQLKPHLHTLSDRPDWIPYKTSYYREDWGFCLSHKQLLALQDEDYEVCIDSSLKTGSLTYGECYLPGKRESEVLISCHACHPSLCNDNLSGVSIATFLAKYLSQIALDYSYRFIFIPGTIGSITWLSLNKQKTEKIEHGLVLTGLGDPGKSTYKKSRRGNAPIDRVVTYVLENSGQEYEIMDFFPYGYDERQFCSPGFNLPVGCFMRSPHSRYPEYHTSADNLDFVQPAYLADSYAKCLSVFAILENDRTYLNTNPYCEPQLGKRGLYQAIDKEANEGISPLAMLWVLNLTDGDNTLLDIAERSGFEFDAICRTTDLLCQHELLREVS